MCCFEDSISTKFSISSPSFAISKRRTRTLTMKYFAIIVTINIFQDRLFYICSADLLPNNNFAEELSPVYSDIEQYVVGFNCSPATIHEFPPDVFTQEARQSGYFVIHLLITFYIFYAFAIVCGDYFVPSVHRFSEDLQMEHDIAGATLMGIATSSPELFTNVVGTFIMKGDIGVGTVVGSAGFNLLIVAACIGFDAKDPVRLDWWPFTRDMFYYGISIVALFLVLLDDIITWWEAAILIVIYALYIFGMYHDAAMLTWTESTFRIEETIENMLRRRRRRKRGTWTLENAETARDEFNSSRSTIVTISQTIYPMEEKDPRGNQRRRSKSIINQAKEEEKTRKLLSFPCGEGWLVWVQWIIGWPVRLILNWTIPNCRNFQKLYPVAFIMSTFWIGLLSYLASWMMTIVGHTFRIPDTVFGVSVIAAGTSVPEVVSSVIVARKGLGTMAVSNSIGSNTFDILVCLGIPWLIRALIDSKARIYSTALLYSTGMLMITLILTYVTVALNRFYIDKKVAVFALILYIVFLVMDSLLELNVLFEVNMRVCD